MGPTALLPLQRKCVLWIFITRKNPLSSVGLEPATEYPVGSFFWLLYVIILIGFLNVFVLMSDDWDQTRDILN
jgi:hypothetical protein